MTNEHDRILLYVKDFSGNNQDRFLIYYRNDLQELSARDICTLEGPVITHDYWMIASSIFEIAGNLPDNVIDIVEFEHAISGVKVDRESREQWTLGRTFREYLGDSNLDEYEDVYNQREPFSSQTYAHAAAEIKKIWLALIEKSTRLGELQRYLQIEAPCFNYLWKCLVKGIRIDNDVLKAHKASIQDQYYLSLKAFCLEFNLPIQYPSEKAIRQYLIEDGFDAEHESLDYILELLPTNNDYGKKLLSLRNIFRSKSVLLDIPSSSRRVKPIVDVAGTVTSRIMLRNPALQNLASKYRNIIIPDDNMKIAYVDFSQFEVGIMAVLSGDAYMRQLFDEGDLYNTASTQIFGNADYRKVAKRLFLSYSYGMSLKRLADAASANRADRRRATSFFKQFTTFETWREILASTYLATGRISTSFGNHAERLNQGELSSKERRSCVSQVVQGTASLIFKKALLGLSNAPEIQLLIPMHDAVVFQCKMDKDVTKVQKIMEDAFADHFNGSIHCKTTAGSFAREH